MVDVKVLANHIQENFRDILESHKIARNELTIEIPKKYLHEVCLALRDKSQFKFEMLMDVCGVDYSLYGVSQWQTDSTTRTGFERGVDLSHQEKNTTWNKPRFAVVYQLLSVSLNQRITLRVFVEEKDLNVESVIDIWPSANWFEREAFDLFGILFNNHPDLRRILTDYGFVGHPFRKDFPLIGNVEPRYDAAQQRIVYEPVSIVPRTLVPRVIRHDNRYTDTTAGEKNG